VRWGRPPPMVVWVFAQENQYLGVPAIVVLFGALISAVGALWSSGERTEFERELRKSSDEIARLNRESCTPLREATASAICLWHLSVSRRRTQPKVSGLT
jgi:hypothetical protein